MSPIRLAVLFASAVVLLVPAASPAAAPLTEGTLLATGPQGNELGPCPLEHTDVQVQITGGVARVIVTQQFHNPYEYKIEGVYVFPLAQHAAVDDMTMTVGERVVRGVIKPREEARRIYEDAKAAGHVASLLDQERPNIFTQSVANIEPGARVEIRIAYVETLEWEDGEYRFAFPMVVGPRYIPGGGSAPAPMTNGTPTGEVPDADRITPPVIPQGMRAGHDVSLTVRLAAGLPILALASRQHDVVTTYADDAHTEALVTLQSEKTIPNKDFVLKYRTAGDQITDALLTHFDARGGFFTLILQPPQRVAPQQIVPKEMIFVIDKSGSMSGFPIETAKKTMRQCIDNLNPADTFNLMTFEGGVGFCFAKPVPNTPSNLRRAQEYLANLQGGGGTEMMKAIEACLGRQEDPDRVRIVCFMTDGYVGNDMAIIDAVKKNAGVARVFSFGIGTSVNRYLLDGMARAGRGDVEYVLSDAQAAAAAQRFYERVSTPVLTDITLDWGGLAVTEVCPALIPDLFGAKPVVIKGRYTVPGSGTVTLRGRRGAEAFTRPIAVRLPGTESPNEAVASLWARAKVEELMNQDLTGIQQGRPDQAIKDQVTRLGLEYRLLTQFTSFVAVEEQTITRGGEAVKVQVPVEMPEGVSYAGVFGSEAAAGVVMRHCGASAKGAVPQSVMAEVPAKPMTDRADAALTNVGLDQDRVEAIEHDSNLTPEQKRTQLLQIKLAPELQGLAAKVGPDGSFADGRIKVEKGRIEITVYLANTSEATMAKLKALGLDILVQPRSAKLVIATVEASKLDDLALLPEVRRVELPTYFPR